MRTLSYDSKTGEFELNGQLIGNYVEIQPISSQQVQILHSMFHKPSKGEIVKWLQKLPTYRIYRMSTVFKWDQYVLDRDRPQWEPKYENC